MIARSVLVSGWTLLDLLVVIGVWALGYWQGHERGWHRGRRALIREQSENRARRREIARMATEIRETQARIRAEREQLGLAPGERALFDQEAEA